MDGALKNRFDLGIEGDVGGRIPLMENFWPAASENWKKRLM